MSDEILTVHVLRAGLAVCGLEGVPALWPDGHRWTAPDVLEDATCRSCLDQLSKEKVFKKPAVPVPQPDLQTESSPDDETKDDPRGSKTDIKLVRSQQEIVARIEYIEGRSIDWAAFEREGLVTHLEFNHAKPYLHDEVTEDNWKPDDQDLYYKMCDYMAFAWEKANGAVEGDGGLSAGRSLSHYSCWLWLAGNEELAESIREYEFYGKPHLRTICEFLGLDADQWDDGERKNG